MHHVYDLFLRLLPENFRRRYGVEMALDFEDGWREAATAGWRRRVAFGMRASGDLAVSLLREWTRGARIGVVAATASVTALLWGLALRPWSWHGHTSPSPRQAAVVPLTEAELLLLAAAAMLPVLVVLLFASRLVQRRPWRQSWPSGGGVAPSYTTGTPTSGTEHCVALPSFYEAVKTCFRLRRVHSNGGEQRT